MPPKLVGVLNVRSLSPATAQRIKTAAAARSLTLGQYLGRLVELHDAIRRLAPADPKIAQVLKGLGLETVST
jgi:hypothetical protein